MSLTPQIRVLPSAADTSTPVELPGRRGSRSTSRPASPNDHASTNGKRRELLYIFLGLIAVACVWREITGIFQSLLPPDAGAVARRTRSTSNASATTASRSSRVSLAQRFRVEEEDIFMQEEEPVNSRTTTTTTITRSAKNYGVGTYVDWPEHVYGAYSIRNQLRKFHMTNSNNTDYDTGITQFAVVSKTLHPTLIQLLRQWLGQDHVHVVDPGIILNAIRDDSGQWKGPYLKLFLFNQTQYDKVIAFDADILIRQNIEHWFDYPTPCAIQTKDDPAHNSGAMVISPNKTVFEDMLSKLPNLKRWKMNPDSDPNIDTGTGMYGDQDFLSAYFANRTRVHDRFHTMPVESAALSSSFYTELWEYYLRFRPHIFETVHFTTDKPFREKGSNNQYVCQFLREWFESVKDLTEYESLPLLKPEDHLQGCPSPLNVTATT